MKGDHTMLKKIALIAALLSLSASAVSADSGVRVTPLGYEQVTSISSAKSLTVPTGATMAVITAEVQAIRYRDDGTAPSSSVGMPLAVGTALVYQGTLSAVQVIEQTSGAKVNVLYYK